MKKKRVKRALSLLFVAILTMQFCFNAYASSVATASNFNDSNFESDFLNINNYNSFIVESKDSISKFQEISSDEEYEDWLNNDCPFYYDENGEKVYDIETFPERYYPIDEEVIGIDDAMIVLAISALALLGYHFSVSVFSDLLKNSIMPWIRQNCATAYASIMAGTMTLSLWVNTLKQFIASGSLSVDSTNNSFTYSVDVADFGSPCLPNVKASDGFVYCASRITSNTDRITYTDYFFNIPAVIAKNPVGAYFYSSPYSGYNRDDIYKLVFYDAAGSSISVPKGIEVYMNDLYNIGYWSSSEHYLSLKTFSNDEKPLAIALLVGVPLFINQSALLSYINYGTTGGMYDFDSKSAVSGDLLGVYDGMDFETKYKYDASVVLTDEQVATLKESLDSAATYADILEILKVPFSITENSSGGGTDIGITAAVAFSYLNYVLDALASYADISVTDVVKNSFMADFSDSSSDDYSSLALAMIGTAVSVTGSNALNDNNSFTLSKKFGDAFYDYLLSLGLIASAMSVTVGTQIKSNVKVADTGVISPPVDSGGGTDLTGVTGLLGTIIAALTAINSWNFDNWQTILSSLLTSTLGNVIPNAIANATPIVSIVSHLVNISDFCARWGDVLVGSLASLGFDATLLNGLSDVLAKIGQWSFANWQFDLKTLLTDVLPSWDLKKIGAACDALINPVVIDFPEIITQAAQAALLAALSATGLSGLAALLAALDGKFDVNLGTGLDSLLQGLLSGLAGLLAGLGISSILDILKQLLDLIKTIPLTIAEELSKKLGNTSDEDSESGDSSGFKNLLNSFMLIIMILVILIVIFVNCLRMIVAIFNIPASSALVSADVLKGIQYLQGTGEVSAPTLFGITIWDLLIACAYFVVFMSVIAVLRRRIDKIRV